MTFVADDRWTCGRCTHTVTFHGRPATIAAAIRGEQKRHAKQHRDTERADRAERRQQQRDAA